MPFQTAFAVNPSFLIVFKAICWLIALSSTTNTLILLRSISLSCSWLPFSAGQDGSPLGLDSEIPRDCRGPENVVGVGGPLRSEEALDMDISDCNLSGIEVMSTTGESVV